MSAVSPISSSLPRYGYTTGTFDLLSEKHLELLQMMKARCSYLIVGLVSDTLGTKQKRRPILSYEHRRALLLHSKYVDEVVEHQGEPKHDAWCKLRFNVLFIGDDYYQREEYTLFQRAHPDVPIYYLPLPHPEYDHTTDLLGRISQRVLHDLSPLSSGVGGTLLQYKSPDHHWVMKPVNLSAREAQLPLFERTKNVYRMPLPPPRNWKCLPLTSDTPSPPVYANITGVNGWREVMIHQELLKSGGTQDWNPVVEVRLVFEQKEEELPNIPQEKKDWSFVMTERQRPSTMFWLLQRYAGPTLHQWILTHLTHTITETLMNQFTALLTRIEQLLGELRMLGLVHGDLHPENICVDTQGRISFLDFGWCYHQSFHMDAAERDYYESCLENQFDRQHFWDSMEYYYIHEPWFKHVIPKDLIKEVTDLSCSIYE